MSRLVECTGCGFRYELPADAAPADRPCPLCGVTYDPSARKPTPPPREEPRPPVPAPEPPPEPRQTPRPTSLPPLPAPPRTARAPVAARGKTVLLTCDFCGEEVRVAIGRDRRGTCPCCKETMQLPAPASPAPSMPRSQPVAKPRTLREEWQQAGVVFSEEDDGRPYPLEAGEDLRCPECRSQAPRGSKVCPHCRYDFATGKKPPPKTYAPYANSWEIGWPFARRRRLFFIAQAIVIPLGILGAWLQGSVGAFFGPWLLCTALLGFVLGTYERIDLTRKAGGQVRLTKTWRVLFWPLRGQTIRVREYEGVSTGLVQDTGCFVWFLFLLLLGLGIIPAVIWYFLAIHKESVFVALTRDHGYPEQPLCRSINQEQMRAIAAALHEVAELPYAD